MDDTYPFPYPYPPKHRRPFPTPPPQPDSDDGNYLNSTSSSSSSDDEEPPQNQQNQIDSSPEILLKRRRVDRYDQDFEFVARTKPPTPVPADWSKDSTFALIEAWGDRFLSNGRRKLHSDQWAQVVRLVNEVSGTRYSEPDCRNRVEVLKKRYEKEKARVFGPNSSGSSCSKWIYFAKMDELMGTSRSERRQEREMPKLRFGVDNGEYVFGEGPGDTGSEGDDDDDGGGGRNGVNDDDMNGNGQSGYGVLADSVKKFGEVCERMENNRKRQAKELESMRMEFQMDLESRKREILERVQSELANIEEGYDDDDLDSEGMDRDDNDDGMDDDGDDDLGGNLSD